MSMALPAVLFADLRILARRILALVAIAPSPPLACVDGKAGGVRYVLNRLCCRRYCGSTVWNIDFAAESISSATALARSFAEAASFAAAARRSSGGGVGISAGGVGRFGSSLRMEAV